MSGKTGAGTSPYDVTADGQRLLVSLRVARPDPLDLVVNWTAGLPHQ